MMFNTQVKTAQNKAAPVKLIDMEPTFGLLDTMSVIKNSPHPNAAKLFLDYAMTDEGQAIIQKGGYIPTDPRVPPLRSVTCGRIPGIFKVNFLTLDQLDQGTQHWKDIYAELFR